MGQDENKVLPMLAIKERQSKMKFAHLVSQKGPDEYAIEQTVEDICSLGLRRFVFKSDQEPSILALKDRWSRRWARSVKSFWKKARWTITRQTAK